MLAPCYLQLSPSSSSCLAWSEEGELAIAATEFVYLLVPRRVHDATAEPWAHLRFKANEFSSRDWSVRDSASLDQVPVTDDHSTAVVTLLAWSPPGLAIHRRSVLAVLTSNHILSLWASKSDFSVPESWERVLIVKDVGFSDNGSPAQEQHQLRIRSMAWAPTLTHMQTITTDKWGPFFLAIGDDNNGVHLLSVRSPFLSHASPWQVMIFARLTLPMGDQSKTHGANHEAGHEVLWQDLGTDEINSSVTGHRFSLFKKGMGLVCSVNKITFGPWVADSGEAQTIVVCGRSGLVTQVRLILSHDSPLQATMKVQNTLNGASMGINRYAFEQVDRPATWQIGSSYQAPCLAVANRNRVDTFCMVRASAEVRLTNGDCYIFNALDGASTSDHVLLGGEINALAFCPYAKSKLEQQNNFIMYMMSHSASVETVTVSVCEDNNGEYRPSLAPRSQSSLHKQVLTRKEIYSEINNLDGQVAVRSYGLASRDGIVATCISLHPMKKIEYTAPSEDHVTIIFDCGLSPEVTMFSWQQPLHESTNTILKLLDRIFNGEILEALALDDISFRVLYTMICICMFCGDDERVRRLRDARKTVEHLERSCGTSVGELYTERRELSSLSDKPSFDLSELSKNVREMTETTGRRLMESPDLENFVDICPACHEEPLYWKSLRQATCSKGHTWSRCALTFLPITEPRLTKKCMDCHREFLNERLHPEMKARYDLTSKQKKVSQITPKASLANHLFELFDTCPYCNGKYST